MATTTTPGAAGPGAKFPQWTVVQQGSSTTGIIGEVGNALIKTTVETVAWPNKVLFFTTKQAAQDYINSHGGAASAPLQAVASAAQAPLNTATGVVESATGGVGDFLAFPEKALGWISNRSNIVRVVKVVVGSLMILTGINMLVKDTTNIDVGGAVTSAAKVMVK